MPNVIEKHSANIKRAIEYIDEKRRETPERSLYTLISDAGARFNLTPKDEDFLASVFKNKESNGGGI